MAKLLVFGFTISALPEKEDQPSDADVTVSQVVVTTKRKFVEGWKFGRPWLRYNNKQKLIFCDICIKGACPGTSP